MIFFPNRYWRRKIVPIYSYEATQEWLSHGKLATLRMKQDLHPGKTMLCLWWDWEKFNHYELLELNQTLNVERYVQQMK